MAWRRKCSRNECPRPSRTPRKGHSRAVFVSAACSPLVSEGMPRPPSRKKTLVALLVIGFALRPALGAEPVQATTPAAQGAVVKSSWNVRDHVPLEKFVIQSHRGAGELAE